MHITFSLHNRSFSLVFIHTQKKKLTEFVVRVEKLYGAINVQLSGLNENLFTATRALFLKDKLPCTGVSNVNKQLTHHLEMSVLLVNTKKKKI